jgi:hypothetical protein
MALLGHPHVPSKKEKLAAHNAILKIVESGIPNWLIDECRSDVEPDDYYVFRNKLLPETWQALKDRNLAEFRKMGDFDDYAVHTSLGLMIMSILADCCAGSQVRRVTDQVGPYAALNKALVRLTGGNYETADKSKADRDDVRKRLVNLTLRVVDTDNVKIERLVALREEEEKESGFSLRKLRHKYLDAIEETAREIAVETKVSDRKEILRKFEEKTKDELKELKHRLLGTAAGAFLTKDLFTAVAVPAAVGVISALFPPAGPLVAPSAALTGIAILGNQLIQYRVKREQVLSDYPISYLYSMKPITAF